MPRRLVTRSFWLRNRGLVGYLILVFFTGVALWIAWEAAQRGDEAHSALCANRADLQQRVQNSRDYLHMTVEERIKRFGITFAHVPATTIRTQIFNYEHTLRSYDALKC